MVSIRLKISSALTRFVFSCQTAYECVSTVKKAFINTSSATLQRLAFDAISIGIEKSPRYNKVYIQRNIDDWIHFAVSGLHCGF